MLIRSPTERPVKLPLCLPNGQVVDGRVARDHQPILREVPVLIPIRSKPVAGVVVPFVCKTHRNPILAEGPQFLDQSIVRIRVTICAENATICSRPR